MHKNKVVFYLLLTRTPKKFQFACVKYTTSVHPEPGSNSLFFRNN